MKKKIQKIMASIHRVLHAMCYMPHVVRNKGMTYVELIVVLSIFGTMSSIVMFNYGSLQANTDIKNLSSDIGLKLVQAQKYSVSGRLPSLIQQAQIEDLGDLNAWKPSYGLNFDVTSDSKSFTYFTDINQNYIYNSDVGELVETININKGNYIDKIESFLGTDPAISITSPFSITFQRPDSRAFFYNSMTGIALASFDYIQITLSTASGVKAYIKIYPSGRIEIK